tara:strand:+ start:209 stop:448 length:240 start_codon:yes stop_codon:yes gene_type:complete
MVDYGRDVSDVKKVSDRRVEYRVHVNPGAREFVGGFESHYLHRRNGEWTHIWNDVLEPRGHRDKMTEEARGVLRKLDLL